MNENSTKNRFFKTFNSKYFRLGGFSLVVSVAVIAIAIFINLIVGSLPSNFTKFDTSELKLYSISDESSALVKAINDDITIYMIAENGKEDSTIYELVERYRSLNSRIKLKMVDPVTNPSFTAKYTSDTLSPSSLIFESSKRSVCVDYNDIYVTEYSVNYQTYAVDTKNSFAGESRITSALEYVTTDNLPTVYVLTGHNETALTQTMQNYIKDDNIAVNELNLLTVETIPEDANCVLINLPTVDITDDEKNKLQAFLEKGGDMVLTTGYGISNNLKNVYALAECYGMKAAEGLVVEGSANNYYSYPYFLLPKIADHEITSLMNSDSFYIMTPYAMGISVMNTPPRNVKVSQLLYTSGSAFAKTGEVSTMTREDGDIEGPFAIAAVAVEDNTKFVWFTSPYILDESIDAYVSGSNSAYFLSALGWICEKSSSVSISSKVMQVAAITMSDSQSSMWTAVMTVILPLATVIIGFVIWFKRRTR